MDSSKLQTLYKHIVKIDPTQDLVKYMLTSCSGGQDFIAHFLAGIKITSLSAFVKKFQLKSIKETNSVLEQLGELQLGEMKELFELIVADVTWTNQSAKIKQTVSDDLAFKLNLYMGIKGITTMPYNKEGVSLTLSDIPLSVYCKHKQYYAIFKKLRVAVKSGDHDFVVHLDIHAPLRVTKKTNVSTIFDQINLANLMFDKDQLTNDTKVTEEDRLKYYAFIAMQGEARVGLMLINAYLKEKLGHDNPIDQFTKELLIKLSKCTRIEDYVQVYNDSDGCIFQLTNQGATLLLGWHTKGDIYTLADPTTHLAERAKLLHNLSE